MEYDEIDRVMGEDGGRPVKLVLQRRTPPGGSSFYVVSWRGVYPRSGQNRRFYRLREGGVWAIPTALAGRMIREAEGRGWFSGCYEWFPREELQVVTSPELGQEERGRLLRESLIEGEEADWGPEPLLVVAVEPGGQWRKVMLADARRGRVTFRSCTTDPSAPMTIETGRGTAWRVQNTMIDCSASMMPEFRQWLAMVGG